MEAQISFAWDQGLHESGRPSPLCLRPGRDWVPRPVPAPLSGTLALRMAIRHERLAAELMARKAANVVRKRDLEGSV